MSAVVKGAKATLIGIGRRFGVGRSAKHQTEGVGVLVGKRWRDVREFTFGIFRFLEYLDLRLGVMCTTNAIESLHWQLRKVIKARGHFPNDAHAAVTSAEKYPEGHIQGDRGMASGDESVRHNVGRPVHADPDVNAASHTEFPLPGDCYSTLKATARLSVCPNTINNIGRIAESKSAPHPLAKRPAERDSKRNECRLTNT